MDRVMRRLLAIVAATTFAVTLVGTAAASSPTVAQIEFAGECQTPSYFLCGDEPFGIRYRAALQAGGVAIVDGAFSKHQLGGPGAGAEPIHRAATWWASTGPAGPTVGIDPNNAYFNLDLGQGPLSFPQTPGHYRSSVAPGVVLDAQVNG